MSSRFPRTHGANLHVAQETRKDARAGDTDYASGATVNTDIPRFVPIGNLDFDVPVKPRGHERTLADCVAKFDPMPISYERDVLASVLVALRLHPRVAWVQRMNGGKFKLPGKNGQPQWVRFGFKGMADITGMMRDGRRLECECKRPGEVATEDQAAFLANVVANGGVGFVATSVDDVLRELGQP